MTRDVDEMSEREKDELLEDLADEYEDEDDVLSEVFRMAVGVRPPEDSG